MGSAKSAESSERMRLSVEGFDYQYLKPQDFMEGLIEKRDQINPSLCLTTHNHKIKGDCSTVYAVTTIVQE